MPSLQALPPELIAHILTHGADFQPNRSLITIGPNIPLTPPTSRVSHVLRQESLLLYAKTQSFAIQTDGPTDRVHAWLDALGPEAVAKVTRLHLSAHWRLARPSRGEGHVGFYVRLLWLDARRTWSVSAGTYPIANDRRGMRVESVELLRRAVEERLSRQGKGLSREGVEFVVRAMDVVAGRPVEGVGMEESEEGRMARRRIWEDMEGELSGLVAKDGAEGEYVEAKGSLVLPPSSFSES